MAAIWIIVAYVKILNIVRSYNLNFAAIVNMIPVIYRVNLKPVVNWVIMWVRYVNLLNNQTLFDHRYKDRQSDRWSSSLCYYVESNLPSAETSGLVKKIKSRAEEARTA